MKYILCGWFNMKKYFKKTVAAYTYTHVFCLLGDIVYKAKLKNVNNSQKYSVTRLVEISSISCSMWIILQFLNTINMLIFTSGNIAELLLFIDPFNFPEGFSVCHYSKIWCISLLVSMWKYVVEPENQFKNLREIYVRDYFSREKSKRNGNRKSKSKTK